MGQLVRIRSGEWMKKDDVGWRFHEDTCEVEHYIITRNNEDVHALLALVREELLLSPTTPIVLTYQLPENLLDANVIKSPPITILTTEDVEILLSIKEWRNEVIIYVTSGALRVAKYQFLRITPFTIGDTTYLADGITEEQHLAFINDEVRDDEIKCNGRVLNEIFSEENLVLVYQLESNSPQPKRVDVSRLFRGGSVAEEMSKDATFFKSTWGEMEVGSDYWDTVGVEASDDIINISSDYNMEDRVHNTDVVDIDGSSTGSTMGVEINYNIHASGINNHNGQHRDRNGYFESGRECKIATDLISFTNVLPIVNVFKVRIGATENIWGSWI
ncbi:hypothetical protein Bca4012_088844 [Brassica carinata]